MVSRAGEVSGDPWLDDAQQRVWRQWLDVTSRLPAALNRQLQESGDLSLPDFEVLVQLSEHPDERLRIGALAERLQWERSRLSHHLARMERRLLLRREECADDGRGSWVVLSDSGRRAIRAAAPDHVRFVRRILVDALDESDLAALGRITAQVSARLDDVAAVRGPARTTHP